MTSIRGCILVSAVTLVLAGAIGLRARPSRLTPPTDLPPTPRVNLVFAGACAYDKTVTGRFRVLLPALAAPTKVGTHPVPPHKTVVQFTVGTTSSRPSKATPCDVPYPNCLFLPIERGNAGPVEISLSGFKSGGGLTFSSDNSFANYVVSMNDLAPGITLDDGASNVAGRFSFTDGTVWAWPSKYDYSFTPQPPRPIVKRQLQRDVIVTLPLNPSGGVLKTFDLKVGGDTITFKYQKDTADLYIRLLSVRNMDVCPQPSSFYPPEDHDFALMYTLAKTMPSTMPVPKREGEASSQPSKEPIPFCVGDLSDLRAPGKLTQGPTRAEFWSAMGSDCMGGQWP